MEQKKTLWIIAASGVFLLVVLGAALLLNSSPANVPTTAAITTIDRTPVAATETPNISPIQTPSSENILDSNTLAFQKIENGISDETVSGETNENATNVARNDAVQLDSANLTINTNTTNIELKTAAAPSSNITATSRAGEQALAKASGSNKNSNYVASAQTEKNAKPVSAKSNSSSAASSSNAKPVQKRTASAPAPLATKYWVQAASFTNKRSADNARTELDENKIPAEVFTYKDKKDTLFYRVRVGPYTTKSEAEYWKGRIGSLDFFKDTQSYVTEVKM